MDRFGEGIPKGALRLSLEVLAIGALVDSLGERFVIFGIVKGLLSFREGIETLRVIYGVSTP